MAVRLRLPQFRRCHDVFHTVRGDIYQEQTVPVQSGQYRVFRGQNRCHGGVFCAIPNLRDVRWSGHLSCANHSGRIELPVHRSSHPRATYRPEGHLTSRHVDNAGQRHLEHRDQVAADSAEWSQPAHRESRHQPVAYGLFVHRSSRSQRPSESHRHYFRLVLSRTDQALCPETP